MKMKIKKPIIWDNYFLLSFDIFKHPKDNFYFGLKIILFRLSIIDISFIYEYIILTILGYGIEVNFND